MFCCVLLEASFLSHLSPGRRDPLQLVVLGAPPQDTRLLGFWPVVLFAHAVRHHHRVCPWISAAAEHGPLPQSTTTGFGALTEEKGVNKGYIRLHGR